MRTCSKRDVIAVLHWKGTVISKGRNYCTEEKCGRPYSVSRADYDKCHGIHAEEEAILNAMQIYNTYEFEKGHWLMTVNYEPCTHCKAIMRRLNIAWEVVAE